MLQSQRGERFHKTYRFVNQQVGKREEKVSISEEEEEDAYVKDTSEDGEDLDNKEEEEEGVA